MRRILGIAACAVLLIGHATARADDPAPSEPARVTAAQRDEMIVKAWAYLEDAVWKLQDGGSPYKPYTAAVLGWSFLIGADRVKEGRRLPRHAKQLERIRDYLAQYVESVARLYRRDEKRRRKRGHRPEPQPPDPSDPGAMAAAMMGPSQYTWPLGQIGCFLGESIARGKKRSASLRTLRDVIFVLQACQQENGGWGHDDASRPGMGLPPIRIPGPGGASTTYPATLLASSICALSGLGAAYRALHKHPSEALAKARTYFLTSQNASGTWPYDPSQKVGPGGPSMRALGLKIDVARTSGALYALLGAGEPPGDPAVRCGLAAVDGDLESLAEGHGSATLALQYGGLLAAARGGRHWQVFRDIYFPRLLAAQKKDGSFDCVARAKSPAVTSDTRPLPGMSLPAWTAQGRVYVTAIHALLLVLDRSAAENTVPVPHDRGPVTGK